MGLFTKSKKVTPKASSANLDDFDFNDVSPDMSDQASPDIKNVGSRNPVVKALKATAKGAKDEATSARFIREKILKALPPEASYTAQAIDDTAAGIRNIYDASVKEIRPHVKAITKKIDKLVPENAKALKKMSKGISKFFNGEEFSSSSYSKEEAEDNQILGSIASIFNTQQQHTEETNNNDRARNEARAQIKDNIDTKRFGASMDVSIGMANNIARLTTYNEGPNQAFQKKLLELQYRQLFIAVDTFKNQEKYNEIFRIDNEALVKNSALPDYVKLRTSERVRQAAGSQLFDAGSEYIKNGFKKLGKKAAVVVDDVKQGLETMIQLMDGLELSHDFDKQMSDMDGGRTDASFTALVMKMVGSSAVNKIGDMAADKGKEQLNKREKLAAVLQKVLMHGKDPQGAIKKFFREAKIPFSDKMVSDMLSDDSENGIVKKVLQGMEWVTKVFDETSIDTTIKTKKSTAKDLSSAAIFDTRTYRTINDVIPGYLSRMTFELRYMNDVQSSKTEGGQEQMKLARETNSLIFDHEDRKFKTLKSLDAKLGKKADKQISEQRGIISYRTHELIKKYIPLATYNEMTDAQRRVLNSDLSNLQLNNKEGQNPEGWLAYMANSTNEVSQLTKDLLVPILTNTVFFGDSSFGGKMNKDQNENRNEFQTFSSAARTDMRYTNKIDENQETVDIHGLDRVSKAYKGIIYGERGDTRNDVLRGVREFHAQEGSRAEAMKSSIRMGTASEDETDRKIGRLVNYIALCFLKNRNYEELGIPKRNKFTEAFLLKSVIAKINEIIAPIATVANKQTFLTKCKEIGEKEWNKERLDNIVMQIDASDVNIKTNLHPLGSSAGQKALSTINSLTGYSYNFKPGNGKDPGKTYFGSTAQDMNKAGGESLAPGGKSVDLLSAAGLAQEAIRQVDAKVSSLESRASGGDGYSATIALNTARTNRILAIIAGQGRITSAVAGISLNQHGIDLGKDKHLTDVLTDAAGNVIDLAWMTGKGTVKATMKTLQVLNSNILMPLYKKAVAIKDPTIALAGKLYDRAAEGVHKAWDIGSDIVTNKVPSALGWAHDKLMQGKDKAMMAFRFTKDYVTENGKVLHAELLKAGAYIREDTGEVIKKLSDIKGNIVDKAGNLIMSVSDYGQGLYDDKGNKIRLYGSALYDKAKQGLHKAWDIGTNLGQHAMDFASNTYHGKNFLGKAIRVAGNTVKGALGGLGIHLGAGTGERATYNVLLDIRDLLRKGNKKVKLRSDGDEQELLKKEAGQSAMKEEVMGTINEQWVNKSETIKKLRVEAEAKAALYKDKGIAAAKKYLQGDSYLAGKAQALNSHFGSAKDKLLNALGMTDEARHYRNFVGPHPELVGPIAPKHEWKTKGLVGGWLGKLNPSKKKNPTITDIVKEQVVEAIGQEVAAEKNKAVKDAQKGKPSMLARMMDKITGGVFSKKKGQVDNDKDGDGKRDGNVDDESKFKRLIKGGWLSKLNPFSKKEGSGTAKAEDSSSLGMFGLVGGAIKLVGVFASLATVASGIYWAFNKIMSLFGMGKKNLDPNGKELGYSAADLGGDVLGAGAAMYAGKKLGLGKLAKWGGSKLGLGKGIASAASAGAAVVEGGAAVAKAGRLASLGKTAFNIGKIGLIGADMALTGGLGTMAVTALTAVAGLITAPVVLGVATVAAIGTAAYFTYKWAKKDGVLWKIRYAQYGFIENGQDDMYFSKLEKLEDYLQENKLVVKEGNGWQISPKIDTPVLLKMMDVDMTSDLEQNNFAQWFHNRFKPFYLGFITALNNRGLSSPDDVYGLDDLAMKEFLSEITMTNGPYAFPVSPFIRKPSCNDTKAYTKELITFAENDLLKKKALSKWNLVDYFSLNQKSKDLEKKVAEQNLAKQEQQSSQQEMKQKLQAALMPAVQRSIASNAYNAKYGLDGEDGNNDMGGIPSGIIDPATVFKKAASALMIATGAIRDAKGDMTWVKLGPNVNMDGLNPQVRANFLAMCQEYGELTKKSIRVNSAFRTVAQQEALKGAENSMHLYGFALDIASEDANRLEALGLMRKYGFTRPVGGEPWHIEPAGIQASIARFSTLMQHGPGDAAPAELTQLVVDSINRGGGGLGSLDDPSIRKESRDAALAAKFFEKGGQEIDPSNDQKLGLLDQKLGTVYKSANSIMSTIDGDKKRLADQAGIGADGKPIVTDGKISAGLRAGEEKDLRIFSGDKYSDARNKVSSTAKDLGMDENEAMVTAYRESKFGTQTGGSKGIMQIMPDTVAGLVKNHRAEIMAKGFNPDKLDVNDIKTNMYLMSLLSKEDGARYKKDTGMDASPEMKYLMHMLGSTVSAKLTTAIKGGNLDTSINEFINIKDINNNAQELLLPDGSIPTIRQLFAHQKNRYNSMLAGIKGGNAPSTATTAAAAGVITPVASIENVGAYPTYAKKPANDDTFAATPTQTSANGVNDVIAATANTKVSTPPMTDTAVVAPTSAKVTNIDDFNRKVSEANKAIIAKAEDNSSTPGLIKTSTGVAKTKVSSLDNQQTPAQTLQASHAIHVESLDVEKQMLQALLTLVGTMSPEALSGLKNGISKQEKGAASKPPSSGKDIGDRTPISMRRQLQA